MGRTASPSCSCSTTALDNDRFVSYGFPADYQAQVWETRASLLSNDAFLGGAVKAQTVVGLGYRSYDGPPARELQRRAISRSTGAT